MSMSRTPVWSLLVLSAVLVSGCGLKGDLYLEDAAPAATEPTADTAPADAAAATDTPDEDADEQTAPAAP